VASFWLNDAGVTARKFFKAGVTEALIETFIGFSAAG
jgi:hypothetical protein